MNHDDLRHIEELAKKLCEAEAKVRRLETMMLDADYGCRCSICGEVFPHDDTDIRDDGSIICNERRCQKIQRSAELEVARMFERLEESDRAVREWHRTGILKLCRMGED